jgi:hypothetical protein
MRYDRLKLRAANRRQFGAGWREGFKPHLIEM